MIRTGLSLGLVVVHWLLLASPVVASQVSSEDAVRAVRGWLSISPAPLSEEMGSMIDSVCSVSNESDIVLYHVVSLRPEGYVVCSADRGVEPILMFSASGHYDLDPRNPLRAFLTRDVAARLPVKVAATEVAVQAGSAGTNAVESESAYSSKWGRLLAAGEPEPLTKDPDRPMAASSALASVNDLRVDSFVQTRWHQLTAGGAACYNYYTPPNDPGDSDNDPSGCTATAWAQLMRYFEYPTQPINPDPLYQYAVWRGYWYWVDYTPIGGDGVGGSYRWDLMPYNPIGASEAQRQAIGALCADIGGACWAKYSSTETSAIFYHEKLMNFFGYGNVLSIYPGSSYKSEEGVYTTEIRPNLDARLPVMLTIWDDIYGHVVVCDGYGFNLETSYYHLNFGWAGNSDGWYNLPDMNMGQYNYNFIEEICCNIYTNGTGYIISGRVFDKGAPVVGAQVSAVVCGVTNYATSDSRGIYAVTHIPIADYDDPQYENVVIMGAKKAGLVFASTEVRPAFDPSLSGNVWGADLYTVTPGYSGGSGTESDPYQIANKQDLLVLGVSTHHYDKHFIMTADIDLSGEVFTRAVIAPKTDDSSDYFVGTPFSGVLNGNGHEIRNLTINTDGANNDNLGLFGYINGSLSRLSNLGLDGVNIYGGPYSSFIGGLCGYNDGCLISNCYVKGTILGGRFSDYLGGLCGYNASWRGVISGCYATGEVSGNNNIGGLCGSNDGPVSNCYATGTVSGHEHIGGLCGSNNGPINDCYATGTISGKDDVGGLCGSNGDLINDCYATGSVSGGDFSYYLGGLCGENSGAISGCCALGGVTSGDFSYYLGGLCGENYNETISNCYAMGGVSAGDYSHYLGGLCGYNRYGTISNCYARGAVSAGIDYTYLGGFCGYNNSGAINASFWDVTSSGMPASSGGSPKTSAEMQVQSTFTSAGWNFSTVWKMSGYPVLRNVELTYTVNVVAASTGNGVVAPSTTSVSSGASVNFTATPSIGYEVDAWSVNGAQQQAGGNSYTLSNIQVDSTVLVSFKLRTIAITITQPSGGAISSETASVQYGGEQTFTATVPSGYKVKHWIVNGEIVAGDKTLTVENIVSDLSIEVVFERVKAMPWLSLLLLDEPVAPEPILLSSVVISGPSTVLENSSENYVCTAHFSNGGSSDVSSAAVWTEDSSVTTIANGVLSAVSVSSNLPVTVSASYTKGGVTKACTYAVVVQDVVELSSITISGATSVAEESAESYLCMAHFSDGSSSDITPLVDWSEDSDFASISGGELIAIGVTSDQSVTIAASYSFAGVTRSNTYAVTIENVTTGYGGGSGTELDPYLIGTKEHLLFLAATPADYWDYFKLTSSINLTGDIYDKALIAPDGGSKFKGSFDGGGYTISGLTIESSGNACGLFGAIDSGAVVKNLSVAGCDISGGTDVAVLTGRNWGIITNSSAHGAVSANVSNAGGLAGVNYGVIVKCQADVAVSGSSYNAGGLVGNVEGGSVVNCFASGAVSGGASNAGGLLGRSKGSVENCYATGSVSGTERVGGLIGEHHIQLITNCYSKGAVSGSSGLGGLIGYREGGSVENCFWDTDLSGLLSSAGGVGKISSEMTSIDTFLSAGWDFVDETTNGTDNIWYMDGYPALRAFWVKPPDPHY